MPNLDLSHPLVWTVDGVLSESECSSLRATIDALEWQPALVSVAGGARRIPDLRDNDRAFLRSPPLAEMLFRRVETQVPSRLDGMDVVGANELLRCYRYGVGHRFGLHYDGRYVRNERERSLLTFMVYLNDDFDGGHTRFPDVGRNVVPRAGTALLFEHFVLHEGCAVTAGTKYVIRSDIMYTEPHASDHTTV
jgi:predicted 2-oxoglutarate/Fe(II)-dependent dioxygenase YbiX